MVLAIAHCPECDKLPELTVTSVRTRQVLCHDCYDPESAAIVGHGDTDDEATENWNTAVIEWLEDNA